MYTYGAISVDAGGVWINKGQRENHVRIIDVEKVARPPLEHMIAQGSKNCNFGNATQLATPHTQNSNFK